MISLSNSPTSAQIREARNKLWNEGILHWKLDITQKSLYDFFYNRVEKVIIVNASRRLGKSYFLITLALELCIKRPKSIVKYIQPETAMIRKNLNPDIEAMLEDCPPELRPSFKTQDNMWVFPNGSKIHLAGTDNKAYDKLRGGNAHLCLVDEAGFCSDLKHIINSILTPLTTLTGGRIILSSTTPTEPDHEFNEYLDSSEIGGTLIKKTIFDAMEDQKNQLYPRITKEVISGILAGYIGGEDNPAFKTEYLCERVSNGEGAVLPEFTKEVQEECIVPWVRPTFYDRYVAMDIGFADKTGVLFAYWDYDRSILVIEDEYLIHGPSLTTPTLARDIKAKEKALWTNAITGEQEMPYMRVSDNNLIVINDLQIEHKMYFRATEKHDKLTYLSALRDMIGHCKIAINPRCKNLISQMKSVTWTKDKKDFKKDAEGGHYDLVAALLYLSRNLDKTRNPYPKGYRYSQMGSSTEVHIRDYASDEINSAYSKLEAQFKMRSSFGKKKNNK